MELDGGKLPDFSKVPQRHWHNQVYTNQFLYAILAEEKVLEQAGVQIAYYEFPQAIDENGPSGWQVDCVGIRYAASCALQDRSLIARAVRRWLAC